MIKVKICSGTVCHVMGGADLPLIPEVMPKELKGQVEFVGASCIGTCNIEGGLKPPFVDVNGRLIDQATISKVIEVIKEELK